MPVRISEINARDLGPVRNFRMKMELFNLIYGGNELGKTCLVEFIIRSLFKISKSDSNEWSLRDLRAKGNVTVTGLEEGEVRFSLSSRPKLDELWQKDGNIPQNIARLLIVKGSEPDLAVNQPGGVNRVVLRDFLSIEGILDSIENNIEEKTLLKASVENGVIKGADKGKLKDRIEKETELHRINKLFERIDTNYSAGSMKSLKRKINLLKKSSEKLTEAKRHSAWRLAQEIKELKTEMEKLPEENLQNLQNMLVEYRTIKNHISVKRTQEKGLQSSHENFLWLKTALEEFNLHSHSDKLAGNRYLAFLSLLFFTAVIPAALFAQSYVTIAFAVVGVFLGWSFIRSFRVESLLLAEHEAVIERVSSGFFKRFGKKLSDEVQMRTLLELLEKDCYRLENIREDLAELENRLRMKEENLASGFTQLSGEAIERELWEHKLKELINKSKILSNRFHEAEKNLERFAIESDSYLEENPGIEYDRSEQLKILEEIEDFTQNLHDLDNTRSNLKQAICTETGSEINENWEILIQKLREKRLEISDSFKNITAEIIARILIAEVIREVRKQEDERIRKGLRTNAVFKSLIDITGRYTELDLLENELVVRDSDEEFRLSELSTGAREQVLLALRMGFSEQIMGKEPAFLVFDDAFQYSDWKHRKRLVEQVIRVARNGWQIICLTMDDHIRDLFRKRASSVFGDQFRFADLSKN